MWLLSRLLWVGHPDHIITIPPGARRDSLSKRLMLVVFFWAPRVLVFAFSTKLVNSALWLRQSLFQMCGLCALGFHVGTLQAEGHIWFIWFASRACAAVYLVENPTGSSLKCIRPRICWRISLKRPNPRRIVTVYCTFWQQLNEDSLFSLWYRSAFLNMYQNSSLL